MTQDKCHAASGWVPNSSGIEGKSEREERLRNRRGLSHLTVGILLITQDEITTRKSHLKENYFAH